jgi:hypothetical protein
MAQSICCGDNAKITHISADTGVCRYVDQDFFDHLSECYTTLKPVTLYSIP